MAGSRILYWLGRLGLILLICSPLFSARPQQNLLLPHSERIKSLLVEIDGRDETATYQDLIPLQIGEKVTPRKISEAVKSLYQTKLFSDIEVIERGRGNYIFRLARIKIVRHLIIYGKKEIPFRLVRSRVYSLQEGAPFFTDLLPKVLEEIRQALKEEGYFEPQIDFLVDEDPVNQAVDLLFRVRSYKRYRIKSIHFSATAPLGEEEVKKSLKVKEGQIYVPANLQKELEELKQLYYEQGFRRVETKVEKIIFKPDSSEVEIVIGIFPKEKMEISIKGYDIPLSMIKPLWGSNVFEEWALAEGEAKIIQYLRKKGYLFASVSSKIERRGDILRVIYDITPGSKFRIGNIVFKGISYFSTEELKKQLEIQSNLPFLQEIDGARLFQLPREIKLFYMIYGFPETQVNLNFERHGRKITPIYYINEGPQQVVADIIFEGNKSFTPAELKAEIVSRKGGPFFRPNIQKDIEKLDAFYANHGFRGTKISAEVREKDENQFIIRFKIKEGQVVRVKKIVITGAKITRQRVILRELRIQEGDIADAARIRLTKSRLEKLGIFSEVRLEEQPIDQGEINLIINLREGERNYMGLGLGLETKEGPKALELWNAVIRPRGTAEFIRSNVLGTGAQLSLVGQLSLKETRGVLSWEQPYFFGLPMQTYLNAWLEREERRSYAYDRRGISLTTIRNLTKPEDFVILFTLRLARTSLYKLFVAESEVDRQHFPFSTTSVSGSFVWDRRDDAFNPTRGFFLSSSLEWAYPLFNAESNFQKVFSKFQYYYSLSLPQLTFSATARLGLGRGRIPIHERFFGGGSHSFRGTEFDELGPKDPESGNPVGGKALFILNLEMTFPLISELRYLQGAVFYDSGRVFQERRQFNPLEFQHALGLGLRYKTPLGPVRFEIGWNLNPSPGEKSFHLFLTIGNVF
ncbi:MAG: outer membrane protein assembly factor BamA [Candidatus Aminicenantes bacterium]|nr:outer membrane protein assembly factor BamA [Candidatus Aminicenantes bacterium]